MKKIIVFLLIIILAIPAIGYGYYMTMLKSPGGQNETIEVEIQSGSSLKKAAEILQEKNVIRNKNVFLLYARLNDMENIKSGKYHFESSDNTSMVLSKLNKGEMPLGEKITIPEGFEVIDIAKKLSDSNLVDFDSFVSKAQNKTPYENEYVFLKEGDIQSLEGYLYPDTYFIEKGTSEEDIIKMFLSRFQKAYNSLNLEQKLSEKQMSLNEFITMASVVEREAVINEERPVIAGVFYKRLQVNMPLQSCATVQYILKERKPILSFEDISIESPYNTYKNKGLPPTPIASPGMLSMEAALNPDSTEFLYFVAKGDGGHEFSVSYEDHLKAKKKYLGE